MKNLDQWVSILQYVLYVCVAIPVVGFFFGQRIELRRRAKAEVVLDADNSFLTLRFDAGISDDIKILKIYSLAFSTVVLPEPLLVPNDGFEVKIPISLRSFTYWRKSPIALLTQKSSYWSLTMIRTKTISAKT